MEIVTLIIAVVALVIAIIAYSRTGGIEDLRSQVKVVGSKTDALRGKTAGATETLRAKTADALDRLERTVRGSREPAPPPAPASSEEGAEPEKKGDDESR